MSPPTNCLAPIVKTIGQALGIVKGTMPTTHDYKGDQRMLDAARLARVVSNPSHSLSYKIERETDFRDTVVTLLIDNSGSMRGRGR